MDDPTLHLKRCVWVILIKQEDIFVSLVQIHVLELRLHLVDLYLWLSCVQNTVEPRFRLLQGLRRVDLRNGLILNEDWSVLGTGECPFFLVQVLLVVLKKHFVIIFNFLLRWFLGGNYWHSFQRTLSHLVLEALFVA